MKHYLKHAARIFACLALLTIPCMKAMASDDPERIVKIEGSAGQLHNGVAPLINEDPLHNSPRINTAMSQDYSNTVALILDEQSLTYIPVDEFSCTVTLNIQYLPLTGAPVNIQGKVLKVTYKKGAGEKFDARQYFHFTGAWKVTVTVVNVETTASGGSAWDVTKVLRLENRLQASRDYIFNCSETVAGAGAVMVSGMAPVNSFTGTLLQSQNIISNVTNTDGIVPGVLLSGDGLASFTTVTTVTPATVGAPGSIQLSDNAIGAGSSFKVITDAAKISWTEDIESGLTHYDMEWAWIDENAIETYKVYSSSTAFQYNDDLVFENNASRVTIERNFPGGQTPNYIIPMLYDGSGYLFYRIRPVQYLRNSKVVTGEWSVPDVATGSGWFTFEGHQANLNWQASTSYAEDGKRKTVIQYFDATLRNRQTVTKDNTTNTTVVAETFYDYQGRPAIQVLPAPTLNKVIQYAQDFNQFRTTTAYANQKDVYDMINPAATLCNNRTAPLQKTSGASWYYSDQDPNADRGIHKEFIPDAEEYPYAETRYSQDGTGRVVAQGGVGPTFQLGIDANNPVDHSTKYYYGTANQKELDALFGPEVGDASHYFKNMVRDANGQYSVSYVDMNGRTIATALAGNSPANLSELESRRTLSRTQKITENMLSKQNNIIDPSGRSIISTKTLLVPASGDYRFQYSLDPQSVMIEACNAGETLTDDGLNVCYDCLYDLEITITGTCDAAPIHTFTETNLSVINPQDKTCGIPAPSIVVDQTVALGEGEYTVTKKLTISTKGQSWYKDEVFLKRNICKTIKDLYDENYVLINSQTECKPSCTTCLAALGETKEDFRAKFLTSQGLNPAVAQPEQLEAEITASYNENKSACDALCGTNLTKLDGIKMQMLMDMTPPNGQYARRDREDGNGGIIFYESHTFNIYAPTGGYTIPFNPNGPEGPVPDPGGGGPIPVGIFPYKTPLNSESQTGIYKNDLGLQDPNAYTTSGSLRYNSPQDFEQNFSSSWAEALLPHHPEYPRFKLISIGVLAASFRNDEEIENINNYNTAASQGYMNAYNSLQGNMLLEGDAFFSSPQGSSYKDRMRIAMEEDYTILNSNNGLGQDPSLHLSMWQVAWSRIHCEPTSPVTCAADGPKTAAEFQLDDCDGDWNLVWQTFRTLYLGYKNDLVMEYIRTQPGGVNSDFENLLTGYPNEYQRRIGDFNELRIRDPYLSQITANGTDVPQAVSNAMLESRQRTCEGYKQLWLQELATCPAFNDNPGVVDRVMYYLNDICLSSFDENHPFGAASLSPTDGRDPRSFADAITAELASNGIDITSLCHPYLITYPKEYDKQNAPSDAVMILEKDDCVCSKLTEIKSKKNDLGFTGSMSLFIKYWHGVDIRQTLLDSLSNGCNNIPGCKSFAQPPIIPGFLTCYSATETCISCEQYNGHYKDFKNSIPNLDPAAPYAVPADAEQLAINVAFEQYMNYKTGFNKGWQDYLLFGEKCVAFVTTYTCDYLTSLVAEFNALHPEGFFGNACRNAFVTFFNQRTGMYRTWDEITALYLTSCSAMPDVCNPVITCEDFSTILNTFRQNYWNSSLPRPDCKTSFVSFFNSYYETSYTWDELVTLYSSMCSGELDVCNQFNCTIILEAIHQFQQTLPWIYPDCETRFVTFFNNFFNTALTKDEIWTLCKPCFEMDNICKQKKNCDELETYIKEYELGEYHCSSEEPKGSPEYCKECFTAFMNTKLNSSYTYEQLALLYSRSCGRKLELCNDKFTCEALNVFLKSFEYTGAPGGCKAAFVEAYNNYFKTNYTYDQIVAVFVLYCDKMPAICKETPIENCDQIWKVYEEFISVIRGSGSGNVCMQSFADYFNMAFGTSLTFAEIMEKYMALCGKHPVLCDGRLCGDLVAFRNQYLEQFGLYDLPQQLRKDLFTYLFNQHFPTTEQLNWQQIVEAYGACADITLIAPEDQGLLFACNKIAGLREVFYALNPGSVPENCSVIFESLFNQYYLTSLKYDEIIAWANSTCGINLNVCGIHGEGMRLTGARPAPGLIGTSAPRLCGLNQPTSPTIKTEPEDACNFVPTLALNTAVEQHRLYEQHQKDNFDIKYQEKCQGAREIERFTVEYIPAEYHYTLYYYDQAGNLVKTVPPAGVHPNFDESVGGYLDVMDHYRNDEQYDGPVPAPPAHTMATQYRYNTLNQVVAQISPDGGLSEFCYDKLGRLAVSQNARQRINNQYSYTQYDDFGRIKEVGQVNQSSSYTRLSLQVICQNGGVVTVAGSLANWLHSKPAEQITRTVYDLSYLGGNGSLCPQYACQKNLRNRVSYTSLHPAGTPGGTPTASDHSAATYYSYDIHGNVDVLLQDFGDQAAHPNAMNTSGSRFKKIEYEYDLVSGKTNKVGYQSGAKDAFFHRYVYDAENRITDVETSRDRVYWEHDAEYKYYKHGGLARTVLGTNQVQGLDYAYKLQGWLKGINSTSLGDGKYDMGEDGYIPPSGIVGINSLVARDAFGFSLNYFAGDYKTINNNVTPFANITALPAGGKDLFNGNISSIVVNLPTLETSRTDAAKVYGFDYDQLNRLLTTDVYEGITNVSNTFSPITINNQYQEKLKYDANGNILEYKRNGNGTTVFLNNYKYNYSVGSNRLQSIDKRDAINTVIANKTYSYDEIGNTTADAMQGVTNAVWNVYGKLKSCTNKTGQAIIYTYGTDGQRISKTAGTVVEYYVKDATGNCIATYKKDAAVNSNHLSAASFDKYGSGYLATLKANVDMEAIPTDDITTVTRGITEYIITDHRSNNMVAVSDKKIAYSGNNITIDYYTAEVLTASYYSAYGAVSKSFNGSEIDKAHNRQKRSQEISEFAQTALYWEYNGDVGTRWNVDLEGNEYESPYLCFNGDPIRMVDIYGNKSDDIIYQDKDGKELGRAKDGSPKITVIRVDDPNQIKFVTTSSGSTPIMGPNYVDKKMGTYDNEEEYQRSKSSISSPSTSLVKASSDQAPIGVYNGVKREQYIRKAKALEPLYDAKNPQNPSNLEGITERTKLKAQVRKASIAGADKMLDIMEGPVKKPALISPRTGNVVRFYETRPSFNVISKVTTGLAVLGTIATVHRIATAKNKIREAAKVTTGFVTAWAAMKAAAPQAAQIGIQVAGRLTPILGPIYGPIAGMVAALATEVIVGIAAGWFGETLFDIVNPE